MVVSSNQIMQLTAQAQGIAMQSMGYGQAISAQQQQGPFGALAGYEQQQFTANPLGASAFGFGANLTSAGISGARAGLGAIGVGTMLGLVPEAFDPFHYVFGAGVAGFNNARQLGMTPVGGALRGAGLAGGVFGAGYAGYRFAVDNVVQGVHQQAHAAGNIYSRMPMSGMAMPNTVASANTLAQAQLGMGDIFRSAGATDVLSSGHMTNLVNIGMQSGAFAGVHSTAQFQRNLGNIATSGLMMGGALGVSADQGYMTMLAMNNRFGLQGRQGIGMVGNMMNMMSTAGMGFEQQMGFADQGSAMFRSMGLGRAAGSMYGLGLGQRLGTASTSGLASFDEIGGVSGAAQAFQGAGMRILGSRVGRDMLAAAMTEEGELDEGVLSQITSGAFSKQDLRRMASRNLRTKESRRMFRANQEQLMGDFLSSQGPEGAFTALSGMGLDKLDMRRLTGLSSMELGALESFAGSGDQIRSQMSSAMEQGFKAGTGGKNLKQVISGVVSKLLGPLRANFQQIGRGLSETASNYVDTVTREISGQGPAMAPTINTSANRQAAAMTIGSAAASQLYGTDAQLGGGGAGGFATGSFGQATTALGALAQDVLPYGVYHAAQGGDLSGMGVGDFLGGPSMAKYGLLGAGALEYGSARALSRLAGGAVRPGLIGGLGRMTTSAAQRFGGFTIGQGMLYGIGQQIPFVGGRLAAMAGMNVAGRTAGGVALQTGAKALAYTGGTALRGAGLALRGVGAAAFGGPIGIALTAGMIGYDAHRLAMSGLGFSAGQEGIQGRAADALQDLYRTGAFNDAFYTGQYGDIGGTTREDIRKAGGVFLAGKYADDDKGYFDQQQLAVRPEELEAILSDVRSTEKIGGLNPREVQSKARIAMEATDRALLGEEFDDMTPVERARKRTQIFNENIRGSMGDLRRGEALRVRAMADEDFNKVLERVGMLPRTTAMTAAELADTKASQLDKATAGVINRRTKYRGARVIYNSSGIPVSARRGGMVELTDADADIAREMLTGLRGELEGLSDIDRKRVLDDLERGELPESVQKYISGFGGDSATKPQRIARRQLLGGGKGKLIDFAKGVVGLQMSQDNLEAIRERETGYLKSFRRGEEYGGNLADQFTRAGSRQAGRALSDMVKYMTDAQLDVKDQSAADAQEEAMGFMMDMDPEELRKISGSRLAVGMQQNDPVSQMIGRMGMNIATFKERQKRALAKPGSVASKKSIVKEFLNGDKDLMALLSESGAFGEDGMDALADSKQTQLRATLEDKLRATHGNNTAAVASQLMSTLSKTLDAEGLTAEEMKGSDVTRAIQNKGTIGSPAVTGSAGRGSQAFDQGLEAVSKKLAGLGTALGTAITEMEKKTAAIKAIKA